VVQELAQLSEIGEADLSIKIPLVNPQIQTFTFDCEQPQKPEKPRPFSKFQAFRTITQNTVKHVKEAERGGTNSYGNAQSKVFDSVNFDKFKTSIEQIMSIKASGSISQTNPQRSSNFRLETNISNFVNREVGEDNQTK
jgi:hypothetical protein